MANPHATKQDFESAFKGFHYPISKSGIYNMARDKGGIDREVARVLAEIPDQRYKNEDDIRSAVRSVYLSRGVLEEDLPI
ncbi:MAG: DUF2795 domain-containing protein [Dehalococcoidia bacterium]